MLFFCSGSCKLSPLRTAIATFLEQAIQGEKELSFLACSPQQPSICLPLRDQSTRSALRPWDPWAAWIRKWSSAKQPSAVCEVFNWVSSTATNHGDVTCQKRSRVVLKPTSSLSINVVVHLWRFIVVCACYAPRKWQWKNISDRLGSLLEEGKVKNLLTSFALSSTSKHEFAELTKYNPSWQ